MICLFTRSQYISYKKNNSKKLIYCMLMVFYYIIYSFYIISWRQLLSKRRYTNVSPHTISTFNNNSTLFCRFIFVRQKDFQISTVLLHFTKSNWSLSKVCGGVVATQKGKIMFLLVLKIIKYN